MKLSDFHNEDAVDLLADIIEPVSIIFGDKEFTEAVREDKKVKAIKHALKSHKAEVIEVLARIDGKEPSEYSCTVFTIIRDMLALFNDKELTGFFTSATQKEE